MEAVVISHCATPSAACRVYSGPSLTGKLIFASGKSVEGEGGKLGWVVSYKGLVEAGRLHVFV